MCLLNYALITYSWGLFYIITNGISFCWEKHVYTHAKEEEYIQIHTLTHLHAHKYVYSYHTASMLKSSIVSSLFLLLKTLACSGQPVSAVFNVGSKKCNSESITWKNVSMAIGILYLSFVMVPTLLRSVCLSNHSA